MKPISRVPTKGLPARMLRNLAENQNELVDRVNFLTEQLSKPKSKPRTKGAKK